jgi:putative tricarboxylic transport membrane protein
MDRRVDLAMAIVIIALGVFLVISAGEIRLGLMKDPIGPRAFFYGIGGLFIVGGGIIAGRRVRNWRAAPANELVSEGTADEPEYPASAKRAGALFALSITYAFLIQPLGYLLSTPLFIAGGLIIMGERGWKLIAALSLTFTVVAYIVFAQLLNIRIVVGPLTDLFRQLGWIVL